MMEVMMEVLKFIGEFIGKIIVFVAGSLMIFASMFSIAFFFGILFFSCDQVTRFFLNLFNPTKEV